jgi:O-antigen ligase
VTSPFAAVRSRRPPAVPGLAAILGTIAILALLSVGMALALARVSPSWLTVVAAGLGVTTVLTLAVGRYDAAVGLGLVLLSGVRVEPAPSDVVFAVVIAVALVTGRFRLERVPLAILGLLGGLVVLNLLSAVEAIEPGAAARFMGITLYLALFSAWLASYLRTEERARLVVTVYVVPAALVAAVASAALVLHIQAGDVLLRYGGTRATGLFKDPNVFGPFLVPAALFVLHELLTPRLLSAPRWGKAGLLLALTAGVLLSYSRAAWVNLAVGVLVMMTVVVLRRGGGRHVIAVTVLVAVSGAAALGAVAASHSLGFLEERARIQSYDAQRFDAQATGIALAERHPVGIGPGQFEVVEPISSHSTYVRVLAEQGILGLGALTALVLATLVLAARNAALGRDTYGIGSAALLGAWSGMAVNSLVVDTLHWRHLWLVAGCVWAGAMRRA